jgi:L-ribulose-5-phosphate 3-epimerase
MTRRDLIKTLPVLSVVPAGCSATPAPAALDGRPRLKTAICAYSFRDELKSGAMSYDDLVRMAVDQDVDGLDFTVYWFPNTSDEFLLPLRRLSYRMAVPIYSISIRTDMCRPTQELRDKEVAEIKKWVDAAEKLAAGHIRVFGGNVPEGATEDQAAGWATEVLKGAAEYSASKGVILGLENHGGITARAERILQIVRAVDSPWVGINLDTGNFREDPYNQIQMCLPYAVNAQFKAEIPGADGKKQKSDWDRLIGMFAKSGYKGYLALEYESAEPAGTAVPRLMRELGALARKHNPPQTA